MLEKDSFVELAKACVRACHVLKAMTEREDACNLNSTGTRRVEDLGRCDNPTQHFLLRHIESAISERADCWYGLQEHHPEPTEECLIARRMEKWEMLGVLEVRDFRPTMHTASELPQRDSGRGDARESSQVKQGAQWHASAEPSRPVPLTVRC